jgi:hypothetical protein
MIPRILILVVVRILLSINAALFFSAVPLGTLLQILQNMERHPFYFGVDPWRTKPCCDFQVISAMAIFKIH